MLQLYDVTGRQVRQYSLSGRSGKVDIGSQDLQPGLYHYRITGEGKTLGSGRAVITK